MFTIELLTQATNGLSSIENSIIAKNQWTKTWTTLLSSTLTAKVGESRFHIQRIGCEPPTIEVNLFYFLSLHSAKPIERAKRISQFILHFADAIRHAQDMTRISAFLSPTQARVIQAERERAERAILRDTRGILPDRFFSVQWIAVVSEKITPQRSNVAIIQSQEFPTQYDLAQEGKRQLTERILADHSIAETLQLAEPHKDEPAPTSVTIEARNGAMHTTVSYEAPA